MSAYEPGTVAIATVRGASNVRVMRSSQHSDAPWVSDRGIGAWGVWHRDSDVGDIRPLVVLDPKDMETLDRLVTLFHESWSGCDGSRGIGLGGALLKLSQPPRIPEPGLWGVVEAEWKNRAEVHGVMRWVRHTKDRWMAHPGYFANWDELVDPTLVRPGVEDDQ